MKQLILAITIILIGGGFLFLYARPYMPERTSEPNETEQTTLQEEQQPEEVTSSPINFEETEHDFGTVKQSGGLVTHTFPFTYTGSETIAIEGVATSCGCTTAEANVDTLEPGTEGVITVTFDPNLHAEPDGRFYKTVTLLTTPEVTVPDLKIWAEIDLDLGPEAFKQASHPGETLLETENLNPSKDYQTISAATLAQAMSDKHFTLIDVHTPEQEHISGTDAVIPFNEITSRLDELPEDKDERIVLYCRSGSMSQQAAQALTEAGYTNVIHMQGGIQAYNAL